MTFPVPVGLAGFVLTLQKWQVGIKPRFSCPSPQEKSSSSPTSLTPPCVWVLFLSRVNNVLQLPGICFSLFLLFFFTGCVGQLIRHRISNMTEEIQVPLSIIQGRIKSASWDVVQVTEHPHWLLKVKKCFNLWFFQVAFFFFSLLYLINCIIMNTLFRALKSNKLHS